MDWNSPTTKKHIVEAEAQGCVLLGPGGKPSHRAYRLPCGHEQNINPWAMRTGEFRCQSCIDEKLRAETEAQECVLLGPGRNVSFRNYRLPCAHEQEIQTGAMRIGNFRCKTCANDQLSAEAQSQGCVLLGPGRNFNYRTYRLHCGHEQQIQPSAMRDGRFHCRACLEQKFSADAKSQGCELLGLGRTTDSEQYRLYRLPCGHEGEIRTSHMRNGVFKCQTCIDDRLNAEAKAQGCKIVGPGRNHHYRTYRLPCGHEHDFRIEHMRWGNFRCQTCESYSYTLPSNAYLLHIKLGADEWLKLGYSNNIGYRIYSYKLPSGAEADVLATVPFSTGKEAMEFELALHKKYRRKRLRAKDMLEFHTGSGATECYPVTMVGKLLAHFRKTD